MKHAYIVVSDLHFGGEGCNHKEFCSFLEWVRSLGHHPVTVKCNDKKITIENPEKIILLGDILELWNPKNGDRGDIVKDCMRPFTLLSNLNCDKIYVLGNHDDSLEGLEGKVECELLVNGTKFYIYNGHYPKKDKKSGVAQGLKIGNRSYFFLHGHQFDKKKAIVKLITKFWDPLEWFQDIFHVKFTKNHWKENFVIFLCLLLVGKYFLWNGILQHSFLNDLIWDLFTGFFALSSVPGIVATTQGTIYNSMKPLNKTAEQVIENKYYQKNKEKIDADVVIFGHTHFASSYELKLKSRNKLFLNSGCWVGADKVINGKKCHANTFIYLDETGAYLLKWRKAGKIECIEAFECT